MAAFSRLSGSVSCSLPGCLPTACCGSGCKASKPSGLFVVCGLCGERKTKNKSLIKARVIIVHAYPNIMSTLLQIYLI